MNKRDCMIYNSKGTASNPPKKATRIYEVNIQHRMQKQEEPDREAMARPIGNDLRFTGDLDELGETLQNGTLQGAPYGSVKNKIGTNA